MKNMDFQFSDFTFAQTSKISCCLCQFLVEYGLYAYPWVLAEGGKLLVGEHSAGHLDDVFTLLGRLFHLAGQKQAARRSHLKNSRDVSQAR